ncbi:indole-3-glycerol phosphate synthase-domain-containing protein [Pyronema domesticum]|uniref:Multifunctional tryptophan biosynthesis protein n=1 Tax=Pyronema omphalodes (strain CBS 100304) TaxID=1076935 RepID=U4KXC7_PYROM|nr:indole-3-glycerol phosphate synthase-domain-containing protein [Pyronema domesticum]CCX06456.1 Similar to Anthranilate synthase component 2; acc. no. P00908 [Pyronema omphalodes CBS 100304]
MASRPDAARDPIPTASNVIMIDNYDSFTWNVYQFLTLEGANVTVIRNDKITLDELIERKPTQLIISPGPGHPTRDSGVSIPAIEYFTGKIPIFGVCMGEQCIFSAFGGTVEFAGEIVHGKTSLIKHDGKGIYEKVSQDIAVTRYHSLAGTQATVPDVLEVTSWTDSGVIMGVRHKKYTIEGVQYHPESILTEEGRLLFRNFLQMQGGTWEENTALRTASAAAPTAGGSILDRIYAHRRAAVEAQKLVPSQRPSDLEHLLALSLSPPLIDFPARIRSINTKTALMAEIKRASPSKGSIDIDAIAAVQARTYALAGAATISVLTEPEWFKGSIEDLRAARQAVEGMPNRPAILRKEFIFDTYQILEARLAGADTVLLIVKMLDDQLLQELYNYSKSLGMEPLVEVNSREEMTRALKLGAKVIGVNNRDLHSFKVDLETTSGLVDMIDASQVTLAALSGISSRADVERYEADGVGAVLVGESLMRAGKNVSAFISELLAAPSATEEKPDLLVKICGTRSVEAAVVAAESGADMVGIILVEGAKRCVDSATQKAISVAVHSTPKGGVTPAELAKVPAVNPSASDWFDHARSQIISHPTRSLLVGVFMNQSLEFILSKCRELDLDIVQLHGQEPIEWARLIPVPVIRRFVPGAEGLQRRGYHAMALLDPGAGTGERLDVEAVRGVLESGVPAILAGGLDYKNVGDVVGLKEQGLMGVDVSSGVETEGRQDLGKIRRFVYVAKGRNGGE